MSYGLVKILATICLGVVCILTLIGWGIMIGKGEKTSSLSYLLVIATQMLGIIALWI